MSYNIHKNIKRYRIQAGLTQAELAKRINVPKPTISRIEQNKNIPGLESLINISKQMKVPLEYLIDYNNRNFKIYASIVFAQYIKNSCDYKSISDVIKMVFDKNIEI